MIARFLPAAAAALALAACTGTAVQQFEAPELAPLRTMGYRIAVMPFVVSAPADDFFVGPLAPVGELLALEAGRDQPMHERVGAIVQTDVVTWLHQTEFEVLDPWHVGTQLSHTGLDAARLRDPANAREVAKIVGADGVLYGDVRRWNRGYYLLQTVVEVSLHLELVDAGTGKQLFRTDRSEQVGAGLTGGPTGYVSVATEPLAGLRGSTLRNLTRSVARNAVADLNGGELGNQSGPSTPHLALVALAKEHEGPFTAGERIDVYAIGTPDCDVRFDLGGLRTAVPMRQTERRDDPKGARATYAGHYIVAAADVADELPVLCTIQRGAARRAVAVRYRWDGVVSLAGAIDPARASAGAQ